jgi:hypothetical protein
MAFAVLVFRKTAFGLAAARSGARVNDQWADVVYVVLAVFALIFAIKHI